MPSSLNHRDPSRLLERCREGDPKAWADLVEAYQSLIYSVARRHGLSREDSDDVFVATFQILLQSIDRLQSGGALPKWLSVTAGRESLRVLRISQRSIDLDSAGVTLDELVAAEEAKAEDIADEAIRSKRVREALVKIDPRCRTLLQMLYFDDESSYNEISASFGIPVGSIGPTRSRCLDKLRGILAREDFFDF